jgi:ketosteroid isomerase-like protein
MSQENVETVRQLAEAFRIRRTAERGDPDQTAAIEARNPQIEWDATRTPVRDIRGTYHGREEVAAWWRRWLEAWDSVDFKVSEVTDADDHVLLWIEEQKMRGKGSGIEIDAPPYGWVFTFRGGRVMRVAMYLERRGALEAAGLSE